MSTSSPLLYEGRKGMIYAQGSTKGNSGDSTNGPAGGAEGERDSCLPSGGPEIDGGQKLNVASRRAVFSEGPKESAVI